MQIEKQKQSKTQELRIHNSKKGNKIKPSITSLNIILACN